MHLQIYHYSSQCSPCAVVGAHFWPYPQFFSRRFVLAHIKRKLEEVSDSEKEVHIVSVPAEGADLAHRTLIYLV